MLVEADEEGPAASMAVDVRMGWRVERKPLVADAVEADWDEDVVVVPVKRKRVAYYDSDEESEADSPLPQPS